MNRRHFLFAALSVPLVGRPGFAAPLGAEKFLDANWRLPRSTALEIWPSKLGLDLSALLMAIDDWSIPLDSRLVIRLDDGEHPQRQTLQIQHEAGKRLSIIGNVNAPARCRLIWNGPEDAIYVGSGAVLGLIDGVVLEHASRRTRGLGSAILADEGGVVHCGPRVQTRNFYYGFQARIGGVIRCHGSESSGAGDANYFAFNGGHISAEGAKASSAEDRDKGLGSGFVAEYGGTINAESAVASYNFLAGFTALSNGVIRAYGSQAHNNGKAGYYANTGGTIVAHRASARANCGDGVRSLDRPTGISGNGLLNEANNADPKNCSKL